MRRRLSTLLATAGLTAATGLAVVAPGAPAQAVTNGLGIHAVTKNITQGDTARIKGKVVGAGAGVKVTIQQRSPSQGKDWGSGRTVTTNSKGKFILDREIKGQYTRDYRACLGAPGKRKCSLRARIEVLPRVIGLHPQAVPTSVDAGAALTVRGTADQILAGRTVTLEQLKLSTLRWVPFATATVTPALTFEVSGQPPVPSKGSIFRVSAPPFAGRAQATLSPRFTSDVYAYYPLTRYTAAMGGYQTGAPTYTPTGGASVKYLNSVAPSNASNTFTVNLDGACNHLYSAVFLDSTTAADDDTMRTSLATSDGTTETVRFGAVNIKKGDPARSVDVDLTGAKTLRITQSAADGAGYDPVWYGNATLTCSFPIN